MFQLRLSKPDSFAMTPEMEQPTKFNSNHKKFNSSVSEWTHFLDHFFIQAKRFHISGHSIDPGEIQNLINQLRNSSNYPITTPPESPILTPQAPSPLQSGEYCQGTLDIVDAEGVGVGLLPETQHTPYTPSSHILV